MLPDEGDNFDVGEVCAQVINTVTQLTHRKRLKLEEVPQSTLRSMSSKDRKQHYETIKTQIKGTPLFSYTVFLAMQFLLRLI